MSVSVFRRFTGRSMLIIMALIFLSMAGLSEIIHLVIPRADGRLSWEEGGATIDASNADTGYIMVKKSSSKKLKVRIMVEDFTYTYDLPGDGKYEVYPLQQGSDSYKIVVYENVKGNSYAQVLSRTVKAEMSDENAPFLCPNRYVDYNGETLVIQHASEMLDGIKDDRKKAEAVAKWMKKNYQYDYITALTVKSGYVPDLDKTYESGFGMCFDFASMMCAIMRSQGIPAQMVMGDADGTYHAWCRLLLDEKWVRFDPTMDIMGKKVSKYTEEAYY